MSAPRQRPWPCEHGLVHRLLLTVALATAAVGLAGCPGDGALTKEAVLARAERICDRDTRAAAAIAQPQLEASDPEGTFRRIATYAWAQERILRGQLADLRELGRSESDQTLFEAALAAQERRLARLTRLRRYAVARDRRRSITTLAALAKDRARARRSAEKFGIEGCR